MDQRLISALFVVLWIGSYSTVSCSPRIQIDSNIDALVNEVIRTLENEVTDRHTFRTDTSKRRRVQDLLNGKLTREEFQQSFRDKALRLGASNKKARESFRDADFALSKNENQQNFDRVTDSNDDRNDLVDAEVQSVAAFAAQHAARLIQEKAAVDASDLDDIVTTNEEQSSLAKLTEGIECPFNEAREKPCDPDSKFREATGRCTHLENKLIGMTSTAFDRLLPPAYEDGVSKTRKTGFKSNTPLASPRLISTDVTTTNVVLNRDGPSVWVMQWGQFIAHEYTHITTESGIACCPEQVFKSENMGVEPTAAQLEEIRERIERDRSDKCIPIRVPDNDPSMSGTCIQHTRSKATVNNACLPSAREQKNQASAAMDASVVYGHEATTMDFLRSTVDGKLRAQSGPDGDLLPGEDSCAANAKESKCRFTAGDDRVNTTPNLASTHTMFLRKHNQICDALKQINSHWDDERLFQEARRIIAAIEQHIHYDEWLQVVLGSRLAEKYDLAPLPKDEFYQHFDPSISTQTLHECSTAACRFHSIVGGFFTSKNGFQGPLENFFGRPDLIYNEGVDGCLKGMTSDIPWVMDDNYDNSMRNKLFNQFDIVAFNINRGRDHGLRSYADYRKLFGLSVPKTWEDLKSTHASKIVDELQSLYNDVADIELYIGGVTENRLSNELLNPLFGEIVATEFMRKKKGDRFYFENPSAKFTIGQVNAIRAYSLAKMICDTTDAEKMSPNAFSTDSAAGNSKVDCANLNGLDLSLWLEQEVKTTPAPLNCHWVENSRSKCCKGELTITRECQGDSGCECKGSKKKVESCECKGYLCQTTCRSSSWFDFDWGSSKWWNSDKLNDMLDKFKNKDWTKGTWKSSGRWTQL